VTMASLMVNSGSSRRPISKNATAPPIRQISSNTQILTGLQMA